MVPELAQAVEVQACRYEAQFEFTMRGDWYVAIEGSTDAGQDFRWVQDIANVGPAPDDRR